MFRRWEVTLKHVVTKQKLARTILLGHISYVTNCFLPHFLYALIYITTKEMINLFLSISLQYNLVCDEKYKVPLSNTMFFLGVFCGAFIFGIISDHLGRKKTLAISLYLQVPISLAVAFMPEYISFTVLRFILGIWLQVSGSYYLNTVYIV